MTEKYKPARGDRIKTLILCSSCHKNKITVYLEPGQKAIQKICLRCKQRVTPKENSSELDGLIRAVFLHHGAEEPIILTPESAQFNQAAEEFWANRKDEKKSLSYYYNIFGKGE